MKIVIFIVDSLRAANISCYGYHKNTSPNIDTIAKENVLFENATPQSNWTYPSLYSLISGKYASKLKFSFFDQKINESLKVLPEVLSEKGFHTAIFSNFQSLINKATFGSHLDEAKYVKLNNDAINHFREWIRKYKDSFLLFHIGEYVHEPYFAEKEYVCNFLDKDIDPEAPEIFDEAIKALTDRSAYSNKLRNSIPNINRRINLRLLRLSKKQLKYLLAAYDAGIYLIDSYISKMYKIIKDAATDYIFILTADHGQSFMEHGFWGHGLHLYDEVAKVPLICDFNGKFTKKVTDPVQLLDLYPTMTEFLGLEPFHRLDGSSLLPLLNGEETMERYAVSEGYPFVSLRKGRYKLISSQLKFQQHVDVLKTLFSVIQKGSKRQTLHNLYAYLTLDGLYDIEDDPEERRNLRFKKSETYKCLKEKLKSHINESKNEEFPPSSEKLTEDIKKQLKSLGYM